MAMAKVRVIKDSVKYDKATVFRGNLDVIENNKRLYTIKGRIDRLCVSDAYRDAEIKAQELNIGIIN